MVANVGAVGQITCRVSGATIEATQQSYSLTGCQLDPGAEKRQQSPVACGGCWGTDC